MKLMSPPARASWTHQGLREGFEVAFFDDRRGTHRLMGHTTANESGVLWSVGYEIAADLSWRTLAVRAAHLSVTGAGDLVLTRDNEDRHT
ncbi:putative glycolipid-binding domain-containing protein [Microbacterium sp.]|jgi:hypothetical protein|uniref:putative glycolipid-binding domain-containing protein n=1 Tax=Microbacterium sp. TaxID=51671 RepID=UPI0037C8858B